MKLFPIALLAALAAAPAAHAQASKADPHAAHHNGTAAAGDMAEGEVRKIDKSQSRLTLKHGEIKALDMPPMTMVFGVKDKALLDTVKEGDKVRFRAAIEGGKYLVTEIAPLPR